MIQKFYARRHGRWVLLAFVVSKHVVFYKTFFSCFEYKKHICIFSSSVKKKRETGVGIFTPQLCLKLVETGEVKLAESFDFKEPKEYVCNHLLYCCSPKCRKVCSGKLCDSGMSQLTFSPLSVSLIQQTL